MRKSRSCVEGGRDRANELNQFYNRFDHPVAVAYPTPSPGAVSVSAGVQGHSTPLPHLTNPNKPQHSQHPPSSKMSTTPSTSQQPPSTGAPRDMEPPHHPPPPPSQPLPPTITADQVRLGLKRLNPRKAAGPDKVCPRLLKTCAVKLGEPLRCLFDLSLCLGRAPTLWKTSCLIPVPKKTHPK